MKIIKVEANKKPRVIEIEESLSSLQREVDGYIEALYPFDDSVALVCNDEGKMIGLDLNRAVRDANGQIYDVIAGTFLVVGLGEEDFDSLTDEQTDKYMKYYEEPEHFFTINGRMVCMKD